MLLATDGGLVNPCGPVLLVPEADAAAAALAFAFAPAATLFALAIVAGAAAGGGTGIDGVLGNRGIT